MAKTPVRLSEPQLNMLREFARIKDEGREPTLAELAENLGYADKSGAQRIMDRLEAIGVISPRRVVEREITPKGAKYL